MFCVMGICLHVTVQTHSALEGPVTLVCYIINYPTSPSHTILTSGKPAFVQPCGALVKLPHGVPILNTWFIPIGDRTLNL